MPTLFPTHLILAVLCSLAAFNSHATESVGCHVSYGGETLRLQAGPATLPYQVGVTAIGSYFLFRIVFETEPQALAAIKLYIYADRNEGATPIQQATYPYPLSNQQGHYGFTGLQTVYEPVRDGELQYWCELIPHAINKGAMP